MRLKLYLAPACLACAVFGAQADPMLPTTYFIEGGVAPRGAYSVTAGVAWPWQWRHEMAGGAFTAQTEAFISDWRARGVGGGHVSFVQLGLQPIVRYHLGKEADAWFVEGGIGLSYTDRLYVTAHKTFSTRFNFADTAGVGKTFGGGAHELALRVSHFSNGGYKHPNPGENFLQLRYASRF